ncbi:kinesin-like protein KIN-1 [Rhincodon typus]|uniref:kinesin-like protein KIN-1 n=1 Tax=Rhincodon typus TaxID=259920 RepID=UPI00202FCB5C|nr:kinesin-like protein KIN-1 [Rhincodon typus]
MNIDVVARIQPSRQPGQGHSLQISAEGKTIYTASDGGAACRFQEIFDQNASTQEIFTRTVQPLLSVFTEGMNTCVVVFGETDSGKLYTLVGDKNDRLAIIPLTIDYIFDAPYLQKLQATAMWSLSISMYEIYAEVLKDLLDSNGTDPVNLKIMCNAQEGTFIKGLTCVTASSAADAISIFHQGWARRTGANVDFGPAESQATVITQLNLLVVLTALADFDWDNSVDTFGLNVFVHEKWKIESSIPVLVATRWSWVNVLACGNDC